MYAIRSYYAFLDKYPTLEDYREKLKGDSKKLFGPLFGEHPNNIVFKDGVISIKESDGSLREIGRNIPGFETEKDLFAFIDKNNMHKKTMKSLMAEEYKFEFFDDNTPKLYSANEKLSEINAIDSYNFV